MFFRLCLAACLVGCLGAACQAVDRPNVLWLIAEDMGPELGCYGHPGVRTPAIDALAAEGVRFTHAYTVTPVCSTSRSSFITGMYCTTIGAHNHRSHRNDGFHLPDGVRIISDWFRDAGYFTANIKKFPPGIDVEGSGKTDWNFAYDGKPFDSDRWDSLASHQPFYAQVNFHETHRGKAWENAHERIEKTADPARLRIPAYYPDHELTRQDWAQYLNCVMALDAQVGRIIGLLKQQGLYENTVIVMMSDHGQAMVRGKQWPYESGLHIPLIIRWPENFPAPAEFHRGTTDERLIASIDLTATSLDWAGVSKPAAMQGRIFWGNHREEGRDYVFGSRDRCDETVDRIRTVRDERYRYIRNYYPERPFAQLNRYKETSYPVLGLMHALADAGQLTGPAAQLMAPTRPREELYDLQADPDEIRNLAGDPASHDTLVRLRGVLEDWIVESDDQGRYPEPGELIEEIEQDYREKYRERMQNLRKQASPAGVR